MGAARFKKQEYEVQNNNDFGYPSDKISTQNTIIYPSGAGEESNCYQAKITVGSTEGRDQTLNLLVDTGSSWTWVKSCDKTQFPYWESHSCPEYYFDEAASTSLTCTDKTRFI